MPKEQDPKAISAERLDYAEIDAPGRERTQSMEGFDPEYTDIVDYILRCTHRIWEEKNVGLIYSHYTHNCVVYLPNETLYDREEVVENTIQRIVTMPHVGMASQVIWRGDDKEGFYTSHLITTAGRHTQQGPYGAPTGRKYTIRGIADCMIFRNRIYREWLVGDSMGVIHQLGLDPMPIALAAAARIGPALPQEAGVRSRLPGQLPPPADTDTAIAHNEAEAETLRWLHRVMNQRMFGEMRAVYDPNAMYHGPQMVELSGVEAIIHQWMGVFGAIPDGSFRAEHICSVPAEEGGTKVAVRWMIEGRHGGWGLFPTLGAPTQRPVRLMGVSHYHYVDGRIVDEWTVYDEMTLLVQILAGETGADDAEST
ncbi:ester cyclase [Rhodobacteraceae bacterium N5(2021)]|uniref:Ester cyclase n=1 Tax=Gymnodinialimonas phycosphaerae TaxID=2841589 RepID=A0A975YED8_9RHOB|nr:ester cyclase [Gymnodinialimonas phycosphaerae]MBY4893545.1 ester cyclase [Gymnodinialimonas phycosphaerae]